VSALFHRFCGDGIQYLQNVVVPSRAVRADFDTDGSVTRIGFMIKFEVTEPVPPPEFPQFECGNPAVTPRVPDSNTVASIVGGTEVIPHSHPWQVALTTTSGSQYCGGTLVHPRWVITAAHCVNGDAPGSVVVRAGMHSRSADSGVSANAVINIIVHENYNSATTNNDIALLELRDNVTFTDDIHPACVGLQDDPVHGEGVAVTGWGTLSSGGSSSDVLQEVQVPVVADCGTYSPSDITDAMICAGVQGKDSCQGDSGGPLIDRRADGKYYLVGIVSWGISCAAEGYPGVYTRISHFDSWIAQYINANNLPQA